MSFDVVIRASSLTMWSDCQRRWFARHMRSMITLDFGFELGDSPQHIGAPIGTGVHAGAAYLLQAKMRGANALPEDAFDVAVAGFEEAMGEAKGGISWDQGTAASPDEAHKQIARMLGVIREQLVPVIDPIAVEDHLEADIGDGFFLSGHRDVYAYCLTPEGKTRLIDTKTGLAPQLHAPQIGAYSLLGATQDMRPDMAHIFFIPRVSLKKPQPPAQWIPVDLAVAERAATAVFTQIKNAVKRFRENGDPYEIVANPSSKLCSPKHCPAACGGNWCQEHYHQGEAA